MDVSMPIFKVKVSNHKNIKPLILNVIKDMGTYSYIDKNQQISNTDWHMGANFNRPYFLYVEPIVDNVRKKVQEHFGYINSTVKLVNYWFQQYAKGDYHKWHAHNASNFSCVYYVDLADDNPSTSIRMNKKEFEIPIKEGEVLIFPSFLEHTSKENKSNKTKTVIPFNLDV